MQAAGSCSIKAKLLTVLKLYSAKKKQPDDVSVTSVIFNTTSKALLKDSLADLETCRLQAMLQR